MDEQVRICKALFASADFDHDEAIEAVEEDWEREQGSKQTMSRLAFFDSLFETVDIWCNRLSAKAYTAWLMKLYERITITTIAKADTATKADWKRLSDIEGGMDEEMNDEEEEVSNVSRLRVQ
jgi:hypothetical protein